MEPKDARQPCPRGHRRRLRPRPARPWSSSSRRSPGIPARPTRSPPGFSFLQSRAGSAPPSSSARSWPPRRTSSSGRSRASPPSRGWDTWPSGPAAPGGARPSWASRSPRCSSGPSSGRATRLASTSSRWPTRVTSSSRSWSRSGCSSSTAAGRGRAGRAAAALLVLGLLANTPRDREPAYADMHWEPLRPADPRGRTRGRPCEPARLGDAPSRPQEVGGPAAARARAGRGAAGQALAGGRRSSIESLSTLRSAKSHDER